VITKSFARIHEANLKEQGILPLTFANAADYDKFEEKDRVSITGLSTLAPGKPVDVTIHKANGQDAKIQANHSMTAQQIGWFRAGSALNALGYGACGPRMYTEPVDAHRHKIWALPVLLLCR